MSRKCSNSRGPSAHSSIWRCSSGEKPEETNSSTCPESPMVVITPKRALVSVRALSTISVKTVSRSRLALMRRLAALSLEMLSRSASISCIRSSRLFNSLPSSDSGTKPGPRPPRPVSTEEPGSRHTEIHGRQRHHHGQRVHDNNIRVTEVFTLMTWISPVLFRVDSGFQRLTLQRCNRPLEYGGSYLSKKSGAAQGRAREKARNVINPGSHRG